MKLIRNGTKKKMVLFTFIVDVHRCAIVCANCNMNDRLFLEHDYYKNQKKIMQMTGTPFFFFILIHIIITNTLFAYRICNYIY